MAEQLMLIDESGEVSEELLRSLMMRVVVGGDEAYPSAYEDDDDRVAFEAITVCCVCGRPVEPKTQQEFDACETMGVHLGDCWHALKQDLARLPSPKRLR